jgi:hypothetical protein
MLKDSNPELKIMPVTQKARNLLEVMRIVEESKYIHSQNLAAHAEVYCGVTNKKAHEYIRLLEFTNKIVVKNGWVVTPEYDKALKKEKKPFPGSDSWLKEKLAREAEEREKRIAEMKHEGTFEVEEDELGVLTAEITEKKECQHDGTVTECKKCGKKVCQECSARWIQDLNSINAVCVECD